MTLPKDHDDFKIEGSTASYEAFKGLTRHFCGTCGSKLFIEEKKFHKISLCSGVLKNSEDSVHLQDHIFVNDTKDGGMSSWLPTVPGWEGFSKESKQVACGHQLSQTSNFGNSSELQGYCQCRSIQFKITRPNEKSSDLHGPFADLLVPYVSKNPKNKDDIKWWLRRKGTKYLAGTCACNSCRTNSGFDIQAWAFIPNVNLFDVRGKPLDLDSMAGITEYRSSQGVHRHFCSKCGATAFWRCDPRPDLIDVSVGMLNAGEGARAESWLEWWTDRISFDEEAPNRSLVENLKSGLKLWGDAKKAREE